MNKDERGEWRKFGTHWESNPGPLTSATSALTTELQQGDSIIFMVAAEVGHTLVVSIVCNSPQCLDCMLLSCGNIIFSRRYTPLIKTKKVLIFWQVPQISTNKFIFTAPTCLKLSAKSQVPWDNFNLSYTS